MNTQLISLFEAKEHLHITHTDADPDIEAKLEEASALYMYHAKLESVPAEWFTGSPLQISAPRQVTAGVKLILSELWWNRESGVSNPLSEAVKSIIKRDPTIA